MDGFDECVLTDPIPLLCGMVKKVTS